MKFSPSYPLPDNKNTRRLLTLSRFTNPKAASRRVPADLKLKLHAVSQKQSLNEKLQRMNFVVNSVLYRLAAVVWLERLSLCKSEGVHDKALTHLCWTGQGHTCQKSRGLNSQRGAGTVR